MYGIAVPYQRRILNRPMDIHVLGIRDKFVSWPDSWVPSFGLLVQGSATVLSGFCQTATEGSFTATTLGGATIWTPGCGLCRTATLLGQRTPVSFGHYGLHYSVPQCHPIKRHAGDGVARALFQIFVWVRIPKEILTDKGTSFTSNLMRSYAKRSTLNSSSPPFISLSEWTKPWTIC